MKNLHPCFKTIDVWENINWAKGRQGKKECSSTKVLPEAESGPSCGSTLKGFTQT
jgi:hypothetical protein